MTRLLLILSIAAGLTITGCGSGESDHTHGEDTHTHETQEHAHDEGMEAAHQHEGEEDEDHGHPHESAESTDEIHAQAEGDEHSHSDEGAHSHDGEESGGMLAPDDTYNDVRKGVRLTLSYNSDTGTFSGSVENTTQQALPQVSATVELENRAELGPTNPVDLAAGERQSIELDAAGATIESWSAQSEIGSGGHTHGEDADHEH